MPTKFGFVTRAEEREEQRRLEDEHKERERARREQQMTAARDIYTRVMPTLVNILQDYAWAREWLSPTIEYGDLAIVIAGVRVRRDTNEIHTRIMVHVPLGSAGPTLYLTRPADWVDGIDDHLDPLAQAVADNTGMTTWITQIESGYEDIDHTAPSIGYRKPKERPLQEFRPQNQAVTST